MTALLFATDLDGTLLDETTYGFEPARPALAALASHGAGLVLVSSKSRAEMVPLAREIGLAPALIVENGGAVLVPVAGGGYETIVCGVERAALVGALAGIGRETGAGIEGFSTFTAARVAKLTGLDLAAAARALEREWDEPFLLEDEELAPAVAAAARRRGLAVTRGGRFFHLTGASDKGSALRLLLSRRAAGAGRTLSVGLGDAGNDLPLLAAVDRPIVIPRTSGRADPELAAALHGAELAPAPGPAGWNAAVLAVLRGDRLPLIGGGGGPR
jgi:mannosyl-3-phosphoglycerate phosphatase